MTNSEHDWSIEDNRTAERPNCSEGPIENTITTREGGMVTVRPSTDYRVVPRASLDEWFLVVKDAFLLTPPNELEHRLAMVLSEISAALAIEKKELKSDKCQYPSQCNCADCTPF